MLKYLDLSIINRSICKTKLYKMIEEQADWVKRKHNIPQSHWISVSQAKLEQELYNQMHNDWIDKNSHCGGNPNCIICNSLKK